MGWARPIQGWGRMLRTQSAKDGMKTQIFPHMLLADQAHGDDAPGREGERRPEEALQHEDTLGMMPQGAMAKVRDQHLALIEPLVKGQEFVGCSAPDFHGGEGVVIAMGHGKSP
jgi:hypothetical protein